MEDLITKAKQRRERLVAELARLDDFLAMAAELMGEPATMPTSKRAPRQIVKVRSGVGAETVAAAVEVLRDGGVPLSSRDLLPKVEARGVEVGGKQPIATLSARLAGGKDVLQMIEGKWHLVEASGSNSGPESASAEEESADQPVAERPADSLNHQTKEGRYAAALV